MTLLMLKRTIHIERGRDRFNVLLTENEVSSSGFSPLILAHFPRDMYLHICMLPSLQRKPAIPSRLLPA